MMMMMMMNVFQKEARMQNGRWIGSQLQQLAIWPYMTAII